MPELSIMIKPVSSACNMNCSYCFYADVASRRAETDFGRMSIETLDNIIRRAMAYAEKEVSFAFQGGEPTLAGTDYFKKVVELQKKYNSRGLTINNTIQTNGYQISEELLDLLKKEKFLVGVSYDGTAEIHDRFRKDFLGNGTSKKVENTIKRLSDKGIDFNVLCVVNSVTAKEWKECFENLSRFGYIQYIPCLDGLNGEKGSYSLTPELYLDFLKGTFDLYYDAFKRNCPVSIRNFDNYLSILLGNQPENCGMCGRCGRYYLAESDGSLYPCDFYVLDEWCIGNINESSLFKMAKSNISETFINESLIIPEKCRECEWYFLCRNGCRRERNMEGDRVNRWCRCYREYFDYAFPRMKEIAESIRLTS